MNALSYTHFFVMGIGNGKCCEVTDFYGLCKHIVALIIDPDGKVVMATPLTKCTTPLASVSRGTTFFPFASIMACVLSLFHNS